MSSAAKYTGVILLVAIVAVFVAGWRLYSSANHRSPKTLGEQLLEALNSSQIVEAHKLLIAGADVNTRETSTGETCLMAAARVGDAGMILELKQHGASCDNMDASGQTALDYLISGGHATAPLAQQLLPSPARLRKKTTYGETALASAAATGDAAIVHVLLEGGADSNTEAGPGSQAAAIAPRGVRGAAAAATARTDWLLASEVKADNIEIVRELLSHKARVDIDTPEGEPILLAAEKAGDDILAQLLIERGCPIVWKHDKGTTPLIAAAQNNLPGTMEALLKRGAALDVQGAQGETALIMAAREGRRTLVRSLLRHGANSSLCDSTKHTAADWAREQGFAEIARDLAAPGAGQ
ncbi:MAG TPA: ankyrin repeat domain-containing protein [Chthonomonadaceae bacterium]|nr:ankyrin repeat domain-containing protein [Chthonomonadaceae bacterium]